VSFHKIGRQLGFQCNITVEEGIQEMSQVLARRAIDDHADVLYHNQKHLSQNGERTRRPGLAALVMAAFAAGPDRLGMSGPEVAVSSN